jgi:hypothetical protein
VFFNNPDIQKPISFGMGLDTALGLFDLILGIARKPPGNTAIIENYINTYSQDDKVDGKRKASELHVGKNEQGVLWLGVKDIIAPKPSVQFLFTASDFHKFIVRDGDTPHPLPLAEVSQLMAVGYFNGLKDTYLRMATPADVGVTAHSLDDQDQQPAAVPQTQQRPANRAPGMEFSDMPQ